jgi:hypothetical protein
MKIVLTVWENRISPVADSAGKLLIVDVVSQSFWERRTESFDIDSVFNRARRLSDLEVEIVV